VKAQSQIDRFIAEMKRRAVLMDDEVSAADRLSITLPYPRLFGALLAGHSFAAFTVGGIRVYSNIRGEEDNLEELFSDTALTHALVEAGFLPFGRPATGGYDRICFDLQGLKNPLDAPVVRVDHEAALSHNRIPRPTMVARGIMPLIAEPNASSNDSAAEGSGNSGVTGESPPVT
jgi:hypothetical protein